MVKVYNSIIGEQTFDADVYTVDSAGTLVVHKVNPYAVVATYAPGAWIAAVVEKDSE